MSRTSIPGADILGTQALDAARRCGVGDQQLSGEGPHRSPINGASLGGVRWGDAAAVDAAVERSQHASRAWRRCRRRRAARSSRGWASC